MWVRTRRVRARGTRAVHELCAPGAQSRTRLPFKRSRLAIPCRAVWTPSAAMQATARIADHDAVAGQWAVSHVALWPIDGDHRARRRRIGPSAPVRVGAVPAPTVEAPVEVVCEEHGLVVV